ncbi:MAG TPA: NAD(P)/FAD-dependent oxidoreductase [Chthoniobacterales bacterium]|jgi:geranylgeranyl reductase family protein
MPSTFDVIIVGAGPAGAVCATVCARQGLSVLVLEREKFPRDKVCGDCLNPSAWEVLRRLGIDETIRSLPHSPLRRIQIATINERVFEFPVESGASGEIGIRRRDLDMALIETARVAGAAFLENTAVTSIQGQWQIEAGGRHFTAKTLVAADGRNSTVARLLNLMPPQQKDRVGIQTHLPLGPDQLDTVRMQLHPEGYSGGASIGGNLWNLCLVARGDKIEALKERATRLWKLPPTLRWRSLTPLSRRPLKAANDSLFLVGDAARVVEPFTGEGIYYALASGELAGRHIHAPKTYLKKHAELYRGRLWVNQLAKWAVLNPATTSWMLEHLPADRLLRHLTSKVTADAVVTKTEPSARARRHLYQPSQAHEHPFSDDARDPYEAPPSPRRNDVHKP